MADFKYLGFTFVEYVLYIYVLKEQNAMYYVTFKIVYTYTTFHK